MKQNEAQDEIMQSNLLECVFDTLPVVIIVSDRAGKIVRMNTAALKLFEVDSEALCRGTPFRQFLHHYELPDEQAAATSLEPWLMSLIIHEESSHAQEKLMVLQLPSEQKIYVTQSSFSMRDAQKHTIGTVSVFHNITHKYQNALHLQRVHRAEMTLTQAIGRISEHMDLAFPQETFLLSPPVVSVEQQLVDVISEVLDCRSASLLAFGPPAGQLYFVAGSGFTSEQEQSKREKNGSYLPCEFVDQKVFAGLRANKTMVIAVDHMRFPAEYRPDAAVKSLLIVPLFLEERFSGALVITRADVSNGYTPEEIELVRAVAAETMLIIECFRCLYEKIDTEVRSLVQQEMYRLINDFLNLASHELQTPLTAIKGNIQVAQRRLATLKRQMAEHPERLSEKVEQLQHTLEDAVQSTRLQERMIQDLIDDARIQANTFELHPKRYDLVLLLRDVVARKQVAMPERPIIFEIPPSEVVPIVADVERISRVIDTYLEHALSVSPADQPVTVQLTMEDAAARVSVQDMGLAIPLEEQEHLWERFHYANRAAGEHEHDQGFGLDFYLSRVFIERHHGTVGVQSDPAHDATFWFTLPIETPPAP